MIPVDYSQVTMKFDGAAAPLGAAITFGVDNALGESPSAIAVDVATAITAGDILDRLSTGLTLSSILVKNGPDVDGPTAEVGSVLTGGSAGDAIPNVALLVSKVTALGGRKNRGRMFIPGVIEADIDQGGVVDSVALGIFLTEWNDFLDSLSVNSHNMVILHGDATTPTPVTALTVSATLATQRRRLRR